jgi:ribosomal protection tetracycline resistance protein
MGILAHVDAGKTSLTERLLFAAGVIDEIGRVDDGSTQTDSLALERRRGITIRSAVASFETCGVTVNLIDTPGHPDFVAEVERVLSVLDGVVLVVSAVEGVQARTRVLMRVLARLRLPTLLFVNKIDRRDADPERVLAEIATKLSPAAVPMGTVVAPGTRGASTVAADPERFVDALAEHDDAFLAAWVEHGAALPAARIRAELAAQTGRAAVHPVFFGSAVTGAGVAELVEGVTELLPAAGGDPEGPLSGSVFTVRRGPAGEKIAYVRLFSGTVRVRDRVPIGGGREAKVTAIGPGEELTAGQIGWLKGLAGAQVGDAIGLRRGRSRRHFAPPTLETVVEPVDAAGRGAMHAALAQLAEQDPLIDLRQDDVRREVSVTLYGEVQKEVIGATLAEEFGVDVAFRATTTICVERVAGSGAAFEVIGTSSNPFLATVGLRVDPAPPGEGVAFRLARRRDPSRGGDIAAVELGSMPFAFFTAVEETVREVLGEGVHGWPVPDATVTMTHSGYWPRQSHAHATFDKSMSSTAGDFRLLTPLVLMTALRRAGTWVCEPVHRFRLDVPAGALGAVLPVLARLRGVPRTSSQQGESVVLEGDIPVAQVHRLTQALPTLTSGEGVLESDFSHHEPVRGPAPERPRTDHNPLDREEYLLHVVRRVQD